MSIKKWMAKKWESKDAPSLRLSVFAIIISIPICILFSAAITLAFQNGIIYFLEMLSGMFAFSLIVIVVVSFIFWLYEKLLGEEKDK